MVNNIRYYRLIQRRNASEVAETSGVNVTTLCNYELGNSVPNVDAAYRIAKTLGVHIDDLFVNQLSSEDMKKLKIKKNHKPADE